MRLLRPDQATLTLQSGNDQLAVVVSGRFAWREVGVPGLALSQGVGSDVTRQSVKQCVFCGRTGTEIKITREHVLPS
jgi:hypothetical protein